MAGWSLYLDDGGRPTYLYNYFGREHTIIAGAERLPDGRCSYSA